MIYALDSNVVSDIINDNEAALNRYYEKISQGNVFRIPPIVFYEIQRGLLCKNMLNKLKSFEKLCKFLEIGEFSIQVWQKAAEIYAILSNQGKPIGNKFDGDIFIAAYCIVNGCTLVTNNQKHFERINGLYFENWSE